MRWLYNSALTCGCSETYLAWIVGYTLESGAVCDRESVEGAVHEY